MTGNKPLGFIVMADKQALPQMHTDWFVASAVERAVRDFARMTAARIPDTRIILIPEETK